MVTIVLMANKIRALMIRITCTCTCSNFNLFCPNGVQW